MSFLVLAGMDVFLVIRQGAKVTDSNVLAYNVSANTAVAFAAINDQFFPRQKQWNEHNNLSH
jgi:hypothetical protein